MRTVVCVLKTGSWKAHWTTISYSGKHVHWLRRQVAKHAPGAPFVCLSDTDIPGVDVIPLKHGWPGWWSKLELFRLDIGPVLYLDLDMVLVGPLGDLMDYPHDFSVWEEKKAGSLNSSVMLWDGPRPDLYEPFAADPEMWMRECANRKCWGDQGFIKRHLAKWDSINALFPGTVKSYKLHLDWGRKPLGSKTRIVSFHGRPKPWDVRRGWVPCLN